MKSFSIQLLVFTIFFFFSCTHEKEEIYDYQYRCGDFYAEGEFGFHTYDFCSIVLEKISYSYKKGNWKFYDLKGKIVASIYFTPIEVVGYGGGCPPYKLIETSVTNLKVHSKIYSDSIISSKIENCFAVELENGKSKLLQEKEPAEILNINWNGLK